MPIFIGIIRKTYRLRGDVMNKGCKLCHSDTSIFSHQKLGDYHFCTFCEYISKDENGILSEQEELKIYNSHNNSIDDPKYIDFFYEFLYDAVFPYVNGGVHGLDFGSGPAPVLAQILDQNHDFHMDIYDLFYVPERIYEGKKYDLITATEVVEHLEDPLEYFHRFADLLKPEGVLAVMTLFHHNDMDHFNNWHYMRDRTHISFYTPKTMHYIASRTGLKIIHTNNVRHTTFMLDS